MIFTEYTFDRPASNLALEQVLLEMAEQEGSETEYLRIWQPHSYMVVLGRAGRVDDDIFMDRCRSDGVPVIRRISGGGTIVTGPGCLMYTVVLSLKRNPGLRDITFTHQWVAERIQQAYSESGFQIQPAGHSDLCTGNRKFSGNAMRMGRTHLIYHGTLLIDFDLSLIPRYLKLPPRRPEYRQARDHLDFVTNLSVDRKEICDSIQGVFGAERGEIAWNRNRMESLLRERFENPEWNLRH